MGPWRSRTIGVALAMPPDPVYQFVRNLHNLPHWAAGLCQSIACTDGAWIAQTAAGPLRIEFAPLNPFGVLDHTVTLPDGQQVYVPLRVIANGSGSEILFTLLQTPSLDDRQFAADAAQVEADLLRLKALLEFGS